MFGVSDDSLIYENKQEKLRGMIKKVTLEKAKSLGIPRRTYFDWKKKIRERKSIVLKNKLKIRLDGNFYCIK